MTGNHQSPNRDRLPILVSAGLLALAALLAYANSFRGPFFFDDLASITENPTIRHLGDLGAVLSPPSAKAIGVSGRPLINLSLAVNYALGGLDPWGYHAVNLAIHLAAGLALFGIVRRTLERTGSAGPPAGLPAPIAIAFASALLWIVHPLQTESVTSVIQRTESLMGLCYLLTVYSFTRYAAAGAAGGRAWAWLAVSCCLLGMAGKEVMVTAPVVVLLYDRTFVSGSFREAWRRHGGLHLALAATLLLLAFLVLRLGGSRGSAAGFGHGVSTWSYLLTQCRAIVLYLRLSIWPHPLVIDYGTELATSLAQVWPQALILLVLLAGVGWAVVARPAIGFPGACFFVILAPSSSIVPLITQTIAEHRMYLPLAALTTLTALAVRRLAGRFFLGIIIPLALVLGVLSVRRNRDYTSEVQIWSAAIAAVPANARAHNDLGRALARIPGRLDDAIAQYEEARRLNPTIADVHYNLGNALAKTPGRLNGAIAEYQEALRLKPDSVEAHNNLGNALARTPERLDDAVAQFEDALRLRPDYAEAHFGLANALSTAPGRLNDAIAQYVQGLRSSPEDAVAHTNLGSALAAEPGRLNDAIAQYEEALRLMPTMADAHFNLANALARTPGRLDDAVVHYEDALRLRPDFAEAHINLGNTLGRVPGRLNDAAVHYEEALRLRPDYLEARIHLGDVLAGLPERVNDAIAQYEVALHLKPDSIEAHYGLANALASVPGRLSDAIAHYEAALRLKPDYAEVHFSLAVALLNSKNRRDEARAHLEAGLRLHPDDGPARHILESIGSSKP